MEKELEMIFKEASDKKKPILIVTNRCAMINGNELEIMNLITKLVDSLIENGYSKSSIRYAVKTGMMSLEEVKRISEDLNSSSSLSELFEKVEKILGE